MTVPAGQQQALWQVIDGILHRVRTGVQGRDLPERFCPWEAVRERHRLWSADGTREVPAGGDTDLVSPADGGTSFGLGWAR